MADTPTGMPPDAAAPAPVEANASATATPGEATDGESLAARKANGTAGLDELRVDFLAKRRAKDGETPEPGAALVPGPPAFPPARLLELPDILAGTAATPATAAPEPVGNTSAPVVPPSDVAQLRAELAQLREQLQRPAATVPPEPTPAAPGEERPGEPASAFRDAAIAALGEHALDHEVDDHVADMKRWAQYNAHVGNESVDQPRLSTELEEIRARYHQRAQVVRDRAAYEARLTKLEERGRPADRDTEQASLDATATQLGTMLSEPDDTLQEHFPTISSLTGHHGLVQPVINAAITDARRSAQSGDQEQWTTALGRSLKGMETLLAQQIPLLRAAWSNGTYPQVLEALTTFASTSPYAGVLAAVDGWFQQQQPGTEKTAGNAKAADSQAARSPSPRAPWPAGNATETPTRSPIPTTRKDAAYLKATGRQEAAREFAARRRAETPT